MRYAQQLLQQVRILVPIQWLAVTFLPGQATRLSRVVLFSVIAAGLQSVSYMMLRPLLQFLANGRTDIRFGPFQFEPTGNILLASMVLVLVFMLAAIQARFRTQTLAIEVYREVTPELSTEAIFHAKEPLAIL